ncbi:MAG: hypothetical protein KC547_17475, partial [Anaerolineae bacterium]|nr:hypothetical protein [Anaerolineae bacterium]
MMKLQRLIRSCAVVLIIGLIILRASADALHAQETGLKGYNYEYDEQSKTGTITISRPLLEPIPQITRVN